MFRCLRFARSVFWQVDFEFEFIPQRDAAQADFRNRRFDLTGFFNGFGISGNQMEAAPLIKTQRREVIISSDQPQLVGDTKPNILYSKSMHNFI